MSNPNDVHAIELSDKDRNLQFIVCHWKTNTSYATTEHSSLYGYEGTYRWINRPWQVGDYAESDNDLARQIVADAFKYYVCATAGLTDRYYGGDMRYTGKRIEAACNRIRENGGVRILNPYKHTSSFQIPYEEERLGKALAFLAMELAGRCTPDHDQKSLTGLLAFPWTLIEPYQVYQGENPKPYDFASMKFYIHAMYPHTHEYIFDASDECHKHLDIVGDAVYDMSPFMNELADADNA